MEGVFNMMLDLHIHSNCSDGALSPKEIIDIAAKNHVTAISIADHDGTLAYTKENIAYAKEQGVTLITGVEMSSRLDTGFHVLGYGFDLANKEIQSTLLKLRNARVDYLYNVCKKLNALGYAIDPDKLKDIPSVTKAHISLDIIGNPDNKDILHKEFGHIPTKGEFIETIMNEGCPAFTLKYNITPSEASRIIHNAGGKVVLAHPVCYKHEDGIDKETIKKLIVEMQADGIEANYLYVNRDNQLINEIPVWRNVARDLNVFTTIGSDFHAFDPLRPEIGFKNTGIDITPEELEEILHNLNVDV